MKIPCFNSRHRKQRIQIVLVTMLAVLLAFSVGTAISASGADDGHGPGWLNTDWYRVWHFIILGGGLFFLLRKPLSQALGARIKGIEDELSELEAKKAEAEKQLAEYNQKFAQLEKETESIVAEYVRQGEEAKVRILKEAETAADKLQAQAQKNIENEIQRVKAQLQGEIIDKALAKAEELVKEKVNADDQVKLVDEYLAKVVAS